VVVRQHGQEERAYAGAENPQQDFRKVKRQLGVISTNDPDNEGVVRKVLYPALAKCGESVKGHEYFYEQNVSTAAQQSQAGTAVMNSPQNPATSVVCFCDPVAPQFSYNAPRTTATGRRRCSPPTRAWTSTRRGSPTWASSPARRRTARCSFDGALGLGQAEKAWRPSSSAA
jgi:hypothetical protein